MTTEQLIDQRLRTFENRPLRKTAGWMGTMLRRGVRDTTNPGIDWLSSLLTSGKRGSSTALTKTVPKAVARAGGGGRHVRPTLLGMGGDAGETLPARLNRSLSAPESDIIDVVGHPVEDAKKSGLLDWLKRHRGSLGGTAAAGGLVGANSLLNGGSQTESEIVKRLDKDRTGRGAIGAGTGALLGGLLGGQDNRMAGGVLGGAAGGAAGYYAPEIVEAAKKLYKRMRG